MTTEMVARILGNGKPFWKARLFCFGCHHHISGEVYVFDGKPWCSNFCILAAAQNEAVN